MDLNKLLSARWIVTILLTITFCTITLMGKVPIEVFIGIYSSAMTYYFMRNRKDENGKNIPYNSNN